MKIKYTGKFIKHFKQRIKPHSQLVLRFNQRASLFLDSPINPILNDHPLKGKKRNQRSFSITGDIRVVYFIEDGDAYFLDIGTHNQVYK